MRVATSVESSLRRPILFCGRHAFFFPSLAPCTPTYSGVTHLQPYNNTCAESHAVIYFHCGATYMYSRSGPARVVLGLPTTLLLKSNNKKLVWGTYIKIEVINLHIQKG